MGICAFSIARHLLPRRDILFAIYLTLGHWMMVGTAAATLALRLLVLATIGAGEKLEARLGT
jgi:hypothetical protein